MDLATSTAPHRAVSFLLYYMKHPKSNNQIFPGIILYFNYVDIVALAIHRLHPPLFPPSFHTHHQVKQTWGALLSIFLHYHFTEF